MTDNVRDRYGVAAYEEGSVFDINNGDGEEVSGVRQD